METVKSDIEALLQQYKEERRMLACAEWKAQAAELVLQLKRFCAVPLSGEEQEIPIWGEARVVIQPPIEGSWTRSRWTVGREGVAACLSHAYTGYGESPCEALEDYLAKCEKAIYEHEYKQAYLRLDRLRRSLEKWATTKPDFSGMALVQSQDMTKVKGFKQLTNASDAFSVASKLENRIVSDARGIAHTTSTISGKEGVWVVVTYGRDFRGDFPEMSLLSEILDVRVFSDKLEKLGAVRPQCSRAEWND
jgi:hypothetical protein